MKNILNPVLLSCFALGLQTPLSAQITIEASDFSAYLIPGNVLTTKYDSVTKTADIGTPGTTSWDFSGLVNSYSIVSVTIIPDTSVNFHYFPTATHGVKSGGYISYLELGTDLQLLGAVSDTIWPILIVNSPANVIDHLPIALGTSWTTTYVETTFVLTPFNYIVTGHVETDTVDAYGNLTLPGGSVYPALRLRTDRYVTSAGHTTHSISYQIMAKNGAAVVLSPSDTNQPNSGTINLVALAWNGPQVTSSAVEMSGENIPAGFTLEQNYPNPFNPTTTFSFAVPQQAFVTLKVYDVLGREVAALVNEEKLPGVYSVEWDASKNASGFYYYQMTAGNFGQTRKLMLMK